MESPPRRMVRRVAKLSEATTRDARPRQQLGLVVTDGLGIEVGMAVHE